MQELEAVVRNASRLAVQWQEVEDAESREELRQKLDQLLREEVDPACEREYKSLLDADDEAFRAEAL